MEWRKRQREKATNNSDNSFFEISTHCFYFLFLASPFSFLFFFVLSFDLLYLSGKKKPRRKPNEASQPKPQDPAQDQQTTQQEQPPPTPTTPASTPTDPPTVQPQPLESPAQPQQEQPTQPQLSEAQTQAQLQTQTQTQSTQTQGTQDVAPKQLVVLPSSDAMDIDQPTAPVNGGSVSHYFDPSPLFSLIRASNQVKQNQEEEQTQHEVMTKRDISHSKRSKRYPLRRKNRLT